MTDWAKYTEKVTELPKLTPEQESRLGDTLPMKKGVPGAEGLRTLKASLMNKGPGQFEEKEATATALAYKSWAMAQKATDVPLQVTANRLKSLFSGLSVPDNLDKATEAINALRTVII